MFLAPTQYIRKYTENISYMPYCTPSGCMLAPVHWCITCFSSSCTSFPKHVLHNGHLSLGGPGQEIAQCHTRKQRAHSCCQDHACLHLTSFSAALVCHSCTYPPSQACGPCPGEVCPPHLHHKTASVTACLAKNRVQHASKVPLELTISALLPLQAAVAQQSGLGSGTVRCRPAL